MLKTFLKKYEEYGLMILGSIVAVLIFYIVGRIYHYVVDPRVELEQRDKAVEINKIKVEHLNHILTHSKLEAERRINEINIDSDSNITNWVW